MKWRSDLQPPPTPSFARRGNEDFARRRRGYCNEGKMILKFFLSHIMPTPVNTGTRDIPIRLAYHITTAANAEWDSDDFLEKVNPVTQDLLRFWFYDSFCENRNMNFHQGQKQAILNAIYPHEILNIESVFDIYEKVDPALLQEMHLPTLKKANYNFTKYKIKMATGTGKTRVMNALLIWQYLNSKY